jgi:hypothetical protein
MRTLESGTLWGHLQGLIPPQEVSFPLRIEADHRVKSTNSLGFLICQLLTNVSECVQLPEQQECICCTWTYSYEGEYILVDEENILGSSTVPIPG